MSDNVIQFQSEEDMVGYLVESEEIRGVYVDDFSDRMFAEFPEDNMVFVSFSCDKMDFNRDDFIGFCVACLGVLSPEVLRDDNES